MKSTDPTTPTVPFTSAPSSSGDGVTLEAIMAQFQRIDACLDTLSDELCQVNIHVSHIARRQACLSSFAASPSPSPEASTDEDGDDGADDDDEDKDEDANSTNDDEMMTSQ